MGFPDTSAVLGKVGAAMKNHQRTPNPDLRVENDPELGLMAPMRTHFFRKVTLQESKLSEGVGRGLFAEEPIACGTTIFIGGGQLMSDLSRVPSGVDYIGVFDEKYFIAPFDYNAIDLNWYMNHSCASNVKIIGRLIGVARKDIDAGEELTVDYATIAAGKSRYRMQCSCSADVCRGVITGDDWMNEELCQQYYEEWPPFIQAKIK